MNAFMNIQVRVVGTGTALAQFKALAAQARASAAATNTFGSRLDAHSKTIGRWGNQVQWAGRQLMYNFTLPIALAMGTAAKFALENEKAMTRVVKVYGDGGKRFRQLAETEIPALGEAFTALSNRFGVHQAQVIGIGADWAAAGASGLALAKSVELTLETMVLGELDAVAATKQLIAIQAQYGFGVDKLSKTVSILNMVENQTGATMKDLMDGMARSAGVARVTGVDVEHLAAMMAALTPAAGSAATAGNALKTILSRILSPTEDAKNVIRAMGIEIDKTAWNALNGVDRLELLAEEFDGLSAAQQAHVATMLGSRWQLNRLIILLQAVRNENSYYNKSLRATASDQALFNQKQYELQKVLESNPQKIQQTWVIIKNAMADVIIPLLPFIVAVATKIAEWAQAFADLDIVTQKWIMTGLVLLALLGPVARYVGALGTMIGLLGGFFGFMLSAGGKLLAFFAAPFVKTFQIASKAVGLLLFAFWKLFYGVTVVMPALARLVWAGMQATIAVFGLTGAAIVKAWQATWVMLSIVTLKLGGQLRLIVAAVSAGLVSIWYGMGRAFIAIWIGVARVLPFLFAATFKSLGVILLAGARFLLNPWVAAIMAIIGVAYHFRDEIVEAFHGMIQWVIDAFWALPEGVRDALMAVLITVRDIALAIYEWMSYLNPFARHSPSLVESVTKGMDEIVRQYARASGVGSIFAKAARDLAAFKRTANQNDTTEGRKQVVKSGGNVQLFDALRSDVSKLQPILSQLEVAVANQERVVDRWAKAVERADQRIENLQNRLDGLQDKLSTLTNAYSEHEDRLQNFASAPLQGMGAMQDAIFANELAQKKLQLQILRTGEASRQAVDAAVAAYEREQDTLDRLQSKLSDINAEIEQHKSALQEFANAPILGMKEMSDAIFENELAQKQLRLEIMKLEDAYGGGQAEDFANTLSKLQQEIDGLQSHISDLRSAGAGSEILGPMQAQLDALVAKRNALANSGSGGGGGDSQLETLRQQLEDLQRAGEKLSLEQSLKFDPLTRQIEELVNAQEEMAFDDIVAGIKREQAAIDALTPAYEEAAAAVRLQEAAVKAAAKARDAAEASYEKERRAVERLEQQLAELQRQAEILQLSYDIRFDPLTREIEKLASAQKELSYDEVVRGIRDEQAAMAALQPRIDRLNAAIATQEEHIKRATAARDALQQRYDRENQELQVLQDQYQKTEELIRDIESALRDMGSAAASAIQKAQSAANKTGGIPESVKTFNAGAGGDWPDPGGKEKIGREFGMGDQSNLIEQFTQDTIDQMNKIFGQVDMFAPLKEWWNRTWQTIKDTVGPHVEAIGGALQRGFSNMGDAIQRSGIIEKVQGVFDRIGKGASWLGDLFAPDWKRLTSGLKKGFTDIWNSIGPELEKFKDIFDPLMKRFRGVGEWLKSSGTLDILKTIGKYIGGGLVMAFKALSGAVTGAIGPLLTMIGDVLGGLIRMLRGIIEFIIGVFAGDWEAAWNGIKDIFGGAIDAIVGLGEGLWNTLEGIFWGMVDGVREAWESITGETLAPMSDLSDQVSDIWNDVKEAVMQPLEDLVGWIDKWVIQPIKGLWDWLADELVGNSVIPDMIDDIFGVFKRFLKLPDWIWKNVLKPIKDFFVDLWEKVADELREWWDRITGRVWSRLTKIGDWVWKHVLKPVLDFFHDLWDDIRTFAGSWWDRLTNKVWNGLTKIGDWFWKNVFKPVRDELGDLWEKIREFASTWWDRLTNNVWDRLVNIGQWFMTNVFKPVRAKLGDIWEDIREFASTWWDRLTGNVWNRLTNMGQWFWNNVLKPIKDKFTEAWNGIRDWFVNNKDRILNPIQGVVRGIISAINFVIRGINKLSELPGLKFHIGEIGIPTYFAAGGDLPSRRATRGFKTNGARAIVGEGKANYPEFVIPTDPTFRSRAQMLLNMAADRVGMYAAPLHASGGVLGVPQYAEGGILGTIRDMANSVGNALTGTVNWIKGNISSLASDLAMGLVQRGRDLLTSNIDWKYGRWAANAAIDQVIDWIRNADSVYEQKARDAQANQKKTSMGPDPQAGDWTRMFWRGHQFNVRTVRMIQEAERRLGETFNITQGSYSTSVAQSGTTHAGGGAFDATSPTTFRARDVLRNVGFAAWVRTQLQGDWPRHIHAIAIGDPTVSSSAAWQVQDYLAGGNGLAKGGIVRARTGGVIRRLAEAGNDEAVVPLPRGWKTDLLPSKSGTQNGATVIHIHGDLSFPNIDSGDDAKVFIENLKSLAGGA